MLTSLSTVFNESRTLVFKFGFILLHSVHMSWDGSSRDHWLNSHTNQHVTCKNTDHPVVRCVVWSFVCSEKEKIILSVKGKCDEGAFLSELLGNSSFWSRHKDPSWKC